MQMAVIKAKYDHKVFSLPGCTHPILILFGVHLQLYRLCQTQIWSRDVFSANFITLHSFLRLLWLCINLQWLRRVAYENVSSVTVLWKPTSDKHFIWMSGVSDEKISPKQPPFPLQISKTSFRSPWNPSLAGLLSLRKCLNESWYFILLVHSGRGHHLLAVKGLGGDHHPDWTFPHCLF